MKNFMKFTAVLASVLLLSQAVAAERKVVIPPDSAKKKLMRIVTVSAEGADFADPVAAVNSITDASESNPYLVSIGPGVYTLPGTLVMKPFVTIVGAGREATTLTGAISTFSYDASSALVAGADNATLLDLTIANTGGGSVAIGLYNDGASPVLQDVTVTATGGRFNYGVYNEYSSSPEMIDVSAKGTGGNYNYGVFNSSAPRKRE